MICDKFDSLSHREKIEFIGTICHAVQSDDRLFLLGRAIIFQAQDIGVLDDVIINPVDEPYPRVVDGL